MRISDWSSDVCSSDLIIRALQAGDGDAARRAIESDIGPALAYIADLAGEDGIIQPHSARRGPRKARLAEAAARAENARRVRARRGRDGARPAEQHETTTPPRNTTYKDNRASKSQ